MCQKTLSLSVLTVLLLSTAVPASAQTYSSGSQTNSSQGSSAIYQQGRTEAKPPLGELTPDQIFLDVEKTTNPETGEAEFVAPTFDPFEQDDDLAGSVNLRSTAEVRDLNNDPMRDGALVEISLYYSDTGDRDFSRTREALFLNGDVVPIIRRDSRELECSTRVTETIYRSDRYYSPGYGGLYRSPPIYLGFSFGGHGWHRRGRDYWRGYRNRNYGRSYPYYPPNPYHRYNDRRRDRFHDRAQDRDRFRDRDRGRDRVRDRRDPAVTPRPAPRQIQRDWGDGQDRRYQEQERFRNNQDDGRRPARRDSDRSDARDRVRAEGRSNGGRIRVDAPPTRDRRSEPERNQRAVPATRTPARIDPPSRVRPQPESRLRPQTRSEPRPQPRVRSVPPPESRPAPVRSQPQPSPRRANPPPRPRPQPERQRDPQESRPDTLDPRLDMFPDGYGDSVVVSSQRDCAREDRLTLFIPEERLEAARFDGLTLIVRDVTVNQRNGQVTVYDERPLYIPANYIEGFRMAAANP